MLNRSAIVARKYVMPYLFTTRKLSCHINYFFCHHKDQKNQGNIWKQLGIDILRNELQLIDNKQDVEKSFNFTKDKVIHMLTFFKNFIKHNKNMLHQEFSILQITPDQIIQDIDDLGNLVNCSSSSQLATVSKIFTYFLLYYQNNHFNRISLSIIVDTVLKMKYVMRLQKNRSSQSNILNSPPSAYKNVWRKVKIVELNEQKVDTDYRRLRQLMHLGIGLIQENSLFEQEHPVYLLTLPFKLAIRLTNYKKTMLQSLKFFVNPQLSVINKLKTIQTGIIGKMIQLSLPRIKTNMMIYIPTKGNFKDNINIFQKGGDKIPVRILYNEDIPAINQGKTIQKCLINIHGGGWMLFTSFISQNHTRIWAKQANILIFSIDYKLAPQHPFPQAANDCLQAYRFLTQQIHKYFNINLKKIIVGGDSAGGSLTCALTTLLLQKQLRIPNGLFLMYPSLDLRRIFYPSRLHAMTDLVLSPSFAELCISSYLKNEGDLLNPLASPLLITEEFVGGELGNHSFPKQWPSTQIIVGSKDPLRDQSLLLTQKLAQANVQCQCTIFQGLKHGFMNTERFIRQSSVPFRHSVEIIKKMIKDAQ